MSREVIIDPVTRIEGHAKITIQLDDDGTVADAHFHVTQFRGFEKICDGRPIHEMPSLMARICGICPVSHLVASAKACDEILAVEPPPTGVDLRRLINFAQVAQSHALSFFHLSSPDLLFGFDADVDGRHLMGVYQEKPQLARDGIAVRRFGQQIIESVGGKRIHPSWVVPGGVDAALTAEKRDEILAGLPEARAAVERTLDWYKTSLVRWADEAAAFGDFPTAYMGLVSPEGNAEYYDGALRVMGSDGSMLADLDDPRPYWQYLGEAVEPWSFLKTAYWKELGYPEGVYRVGPLARAVVADRFGTSRADEELEEFRSRVGRVPSSSFHYHYARLIEIMHSLEMIEELLNREFILSPNIRARAAVNRREGIGIAEAPRGTLIHHYQVDDQGTVEWANLLIATGHNNMAMNKGVLQVAKKYVRGNQLEEPMLNRVEAVIRCYDPCLSCSTHAIGQMPLKVRLVSADGSLLHELTR